MIQPPTKENFIKLFEEKYNSNEFTKEYVPIIEYSVTLYSQDSFEVPESERSIYWVNVKKSNTTNAVNFLKECSNNLSWFWGVNTCNRLTPKEATKIMQERLYGFKERLELPNNIEDAILIYEDWDGNGLLLETNEHYIYFQEWTTA